MYALTGTFQILQSKKKIPVKYTGIFVVYILVQLKHLPCLNTCVILLYMCKINKLPYNLADCEMFFICFSDDITS